MHVLTLTVYRLHDHTGVFISSHGILERVEQQVDFAQFDLFLLYDSCALLAGMLQQSVKKQTPCIQFVSYLQQHDGESLRQVSVQYANHFEYMYILINDTFNSNKLCLARQDLASLHIKGDNIVGLLIIADCNVKVLKNHQQLEASETETMLNSTEQVFRIAALNVDEALERAFDRFTSIELLKRTKSPFSDANLILNANSCVIICQLDAYASAEKAAERVFQNLVVLSLTYLHCFVIVQHLASEKDTERYHSLHI